MAEASGSIGSSAILSLSKEPVELISTTDASELIVVTSFVLQSVFGNTAYFYGSNLYLQYGNSLLNKILASNTISSGLLAGSNANNTFVSTGLSGSILSTSKVIGTSVYLSCDTPFLSGDGTLNWHISYFLYNAASVN